MGNLRTFIGIDRSAEQWLFYLFCGALLVLPMGTSPFTILAIIILTLWIISGDFYRKRGIYFKESWIWPVLALIALSWVGLLYTPDLQGMGIKYAKKSYYWLFALVISGISFKHRNREYLIKALLAGLLINALIGFLQLGDLVPTLYKERYSGLSRGYNTLAILLILGILMTSFYFRKASTGKEKMIYLFLMIIYFSHLIILRGRGGYLTFALLSPLVVYNIAGGRKILITFLLYLLFIGLMSFSPFVQERVIESIDDIKIQFREGGDISWGKKYSDDENLQRIDRVFMWRWAIDLFLEHPLKGVGTGGLKKTILSKGGKRGTAHPHNNFLYMAVSFGIAGILVLAWFFWVLLKNGWQNRDGPVGFFVLSAGLVIFVGGFTDTQILDAGPAFFLAVITGLQSSLPEYGKIAEA